MGGRAYTVEEKREKILAKREEVAAPSPSKDGAQRKRRNAFNGTTTRLSVNKTIPGFHLHVITDKENRIQEALDGGYEFVTPDEVDGVSANVVSRNGDLGERIRFLVNPRAEGSEQYGYLMKQRLEWFEEDQEALREKNNQVDSAIRKGKITGENPSFYIPRDGIKIS